MASSLAVSVLILVANLGTGILTARWLAPAGKGELAALFTLVSTLGNLGIYGLPEALTYRLGRSGSAQRAQLATSGLVASFVLAVPGLALGQLLLPLLLAEQRPEFVAFARWGVLWLVGFMVAEAALGALAGVGDFRWLNGLRALQPLSFLAALLVTSALTGIDVQHAAVLQAASFALVALAGTARLAGTVGLARPRLRAVGWLNTYGRRAWGMRAGHQLAARADMVVLPAVVAASQLGLYSVAVSTASTVIVLFSQFERVIYGRLVRLEPAAAKALLRRATRLALTASTLAAVAIAAVAVPALRLVYGEAFADASQPLWILLPGTIGVACGMMLGAGLGAAGLPGRASVAQLVGLAVTGVGLAVLVPPFGIAGAAVTSTAAYLVTAAIAAVSLWRIGWLGSRPPAHRRGEAPHAATGAGPTGSSGRGADEARA
jgi:O-antigen/teichoic acid export membrane protein